MASTFSQKPYYFNRENLERYTEGKYCRGCVKQNSCPFDASYEGLETALFRAEAPEGGQRRTLRSAPAERSAAGRGKPFLWVHTDALNPECAFFRENESAPAGFVWDTTWLREARISAKRVVFLEECLAELPPKLERREGDIGAGVLAMAEASGAGHVLAMRTPDPHLLNAAARIETKLPVVWLDAPAFVDNGRSYDLNRFSKYWRTAKFGALERTR